MATISGVNQQSGSGIIKAGRFVLFVSNSNIQGMSTYDSCTFALTSSTDYLNAIGVSTTYSIINRTMTVQLDGIVYVSYTGSRPQAGDFLVLDSAGSVTVGSRSTAVAMAVSPGGLGMVRCLLLTPRLA